MPNPSDAILVDAIRNGAVHRFAEIVDRFDREVRAVLRSGVSGAGELEELVHETFYLAFRDLASLDDPQRLGAWLLSIARRRLQERQRRFARASRYEQPAAAQDPVICDADSEWLWEEVDRMAAPFRAVLRLRYDAGLSYREIADQMGVPVSTVRGRIYEARRALRARLERLEE